MVYLPTDGLGSKPGKIAEGFYRTPSLNSFEMNHETLESTLRQMASEPGPQARPEFQTAVWREIHHRMTLTTDPAAAGAPAWVEILLGMFPRIALGGFAMAIGISVVVASLDWKDPLESRRMVTSQVLDLGVFQPNANALADSRLVVTR